MKCWDIITKIETVLWGIYSQFIIFYDYRLIVYWCCKIPVDRYWLELQDTMENKFTMLFIPHWAGWVWIIRSFLLLWGPVSGFVSLCSGYVSTKILWHIAVFLLIQQTSVTRGLNLAITKEWTEWSRENYSKGN